MMARAQQSENVQEVSSKNAIGILLVNLGTPDAPTSRAVRGYLRQFLTDRRVVELNPFLWRLLLELVILPLRSPKTAKNYAKIWDAEVNDSPLRVITRSVSQKLSERCAQQILPRTNLCVDYAMRYGKPSIKQKLDRLNAAGCKQILILPLYPQYSASTTASVTDAIGHWLSHQRYQPQLRIAAPYFDHPAYIEALAMQIEARYPPDARRPDQLVLSFHGLPARNIELGDPYLQHCEQTFALLRTRLGWGTDQISMAFQSRFGAQEWLQPYMQDHLKTLISEGKKQIAITMPGFSADCLETLEEVALGLASDFLETGGERCDVLPCLNDSDDALTLYENLIREELNGWVEKV